MADLTNLMADAVEELKIQAPSNDQLKTVGDLANRQWFLENSYQDSTVKRLLSVDASVRELEEALGARKEELARISEVELPNMMGSLGLDRIGLSVGGSVTIERKIYAGITEQNREAAFAWLTESGNDGIIKNEVKLPFGKGQDEEAQKLVEKLTADGYSLTRTRNVHPQTLKAFVKNRIEGGLPIPMDTFSVLIKNVSKIAAK